MSKILTAKNIMQDLSVRELKILQRWITDEIAIKERNQELSESKKIPIEAESRADRAGKQTAKTLTNYGQ